MKILNNIYFIKVVKIIIIILFNYFLYKIIKSLFLKNFGKGNLKTLSNKKANTYFKVINNITKYVIILLTVFIILQLFGINISSMLAGVGILSIIIGFAIQDALKDIIKGFDILSDSYYQVGDVIKFGENTGKVLSIGLKTTKIKDIYTNNIVSIANRNIELVEVLSDLINIDIPFSYDLKVIEVEKVINKILDELNNHKKITKSEYRGINDLKDSSIMFQIKIYCSPTEKLQVRRDALNIIVKTLEDNNIKIPYNQIDIHQN